MLNETYRFKLKLEGRCKIISKIVKRCLDIALKKCPICGELNKLNGHMLKHKMYGFQAEAFSYYLEHSLRTSNLDAFPSFPKTLGKLLVVEVKGKG